MFTGGGVGWDNCLESQLMEFTEVHVHTPCPSVFLARSLPNRNTGAHEQRYVRGPSLQHCDKVAGN